MCQELLSTGKVGGIFWVEPRGKGAEKTGRGTKVRAISSHSCAHSVDSSHCLGVMRGSQNNSLRCAAKHQNMCAVWESRLARLRKAFFLSPCCRLPIQNAARAWSTYYCHLLSFFRSPQDSSRKEKLRGHLSTSYGL